MEKKSLWWIILLIIVVLAVIGFFLSRIEIKTLDCSVTQNENCNKYCISENDCKYTCGCGCIQTNESCSLKKKTLFGDQIISPFCNMDYCSCRNNICSGSNENIEYND